MVKRVIRDIFISAAALCSAFLVSLLFHYVFDIYEHVSTLFAFAVFLISVYTEGYVYGVVSAFVGALAINYAFAFPYFEFDFLTPVNFISAFVMVIIAVLTGTLTTKLKKHEAEKAESERERMRANLLRAVSHDIRTPLTTIYGSASTMEEEWNELSAEKKLAMLKGIREDSDWLVRMVENLLSVTRMQDGQNVKIIKTPTVVDELIDSVLVKFRKGHQFDNIRISLPDELLVVPMDAMLIEQVIINLMDNAVRHAKGMTEMRVSVCSSGDDVVFEIRDNGSGISVERVIRMLNGHYGDSKDSGDGQKKNAGIGLSVCAAIVRAHGGDIFAENSREGGAVFRFILEKEEGSVE